MLAYLMIPAALAALALLAAFFCYRRVFAVPRAETLDPFRLPEGPQYEERLDQINALIGAAAAIPFEDVFIRTADGLRLHARYYQTAPHAPLQILFHGYRGNAVRDFSGGLQLALNSGYNALLVDQRGHGRSEGKCLTFGVKEQNDCREWVEYARGRFGPETPVVLVGISMGAATVLMAAGQPLPANVAAVVADCGYTSPRAIIGKVMRDLRLPSRLLYLLVRLGARLYGGFDPDSASAPRALKACAVPVLFIHGEDDRFVPCDMSRENFAACAAEKRLLTVPGAGHGLSYMVDFDAYSSAIRDFLRSAVK